MKNRERPGYWLARGFWRLANLLDHIPGFMQGSTKAYKLDLERDIRKGNDHG